MIIILTFLFASCSTPSKDISIGDKIIGQWTTERCGPHSIHAHINIPYTDTVKVPAYRIKNNFSITFKPDTSFVFDNANGPRQTGKYQITDSSLILILDKTSYNWLTLGIDSITVNRVFLTSKRLLFYSITNDTLYYYTGQPVDLILKRRGT